MNSSSTDKTRILAKFVILRDLWERNKQYKMHSYEPLHTSIDASWNHMDSRRWLKMAAEGNISKHVMRLANRAYSEMIEGGCK